ncbi:MAG: DinB family protein [Bryobacterales bacterium]|nr:DinB family protein [Bryobacterales bacterium]
MTYYGSKELAASFRTVRANTIAIAQDIDEQHYGFSASPDTRTVAQTLIHIALATKFLEQFHAVERRVSFEGFDFQGFFAKLQADEASPRNKQQILDALTGEGERFAQWLESLSEDFLSEMVSLPPGATPSGKSRFEMLLATKEHEMHHRAQLMVLERMVGIVPHLTREMNARIAAMQSAAATAGKP